jgi:Tim10/DDP family zinc finger
MSWFGFGKKEPSSGAAAGTGEYGSADFGAHDTSSYVEPSSSGSRSLGGSSGGQLSQSALEDLSEAMQAEQQKQMIQTVILNLTELSFEQCVERPGSSLSNSEVLQLARAFVSLTC